MTNRIKPAIHLAADHAGLDLKNAVKQHLAALGFHIHDHGALTEDKDDDYPDFVLKAAEAVAASKGRDLGLVFGGSGTGEMIAANKVKGIRAALGYDTWSAKLSREHNDANVLSLGGRHAAKSPRKAVAIVDAWLKARFTGAVRHVRRLRKISRYENTR